MPSTTQPNLHHFVTNPGLPYIANASVTETRPHYKAGSNVLSSIRGFISKRPGFPTYTTDVFANPVNRIFCWRLWAGAFFVMVNAVGGGQSLVYKLKIGTDSTFGSAIFTSSVATPFDFVTSNNVVYFGNGTDMKKYDGTTVTGWGIAKPAAAPTATAVAGGSMNASAGGYSYKYAFGNSTSTHIGQVSNASAYTGNFTGRNYTITGLTTSDAQVNQVHIYRTADGGSIWYELPNSPISYSGSWSVTDSALDTALNTSAQASLPGMNAPPTASQGCTFYAGRLWTFAGDKLYYSVFEEGINGVAAEAFYNINIYPMGSEVTGLAVCQRSLMIYTRSTVQRIIGDSLATFTRQPFVSRMGVNSQNNIANGGQRVIAWIDTTGTCFITDGITTQEIGLPIRTDIAAMDQTKTSIAFHSDGIRQWLTLQDSGQNKSWVYDNDQGQWMPPWSIGGTAIHSGETAPGTYTLLRTTSSGNKVLKLDTTQYQDAGSSYSESLTTGLLNLGPGKGPGEVGDIEYVAIERNAVALSDVATLLDEDPNTGTFTSIFANEQDPPSRTPGTNLVEKWYWQSFGTARRGAIKLTWPTATNAWNLYSLDIITNPTEDIDAA